MVWRIAALASVSLLFGCARLGFEKPGDSAAPGDATLPPGDVAGLPAAPVLTPVVQQPGSDPRTPSLGASAVAGATGYDFVISSGADCSGDVVTRAGVVAPIYAVTLADNLALGATYYWCARTRVGSDASPWVGPVRLPVYPWRIRALPRERGPDLPFSTLPIIGGSSTGELIVPRAYAGFGSDLLDLGWRFDSAAGRWSPFWTVNQASQAFAPWAVFAATWVDVLGGAVVVVMGAMLGNDVFSDAQLMLYDPATATWTTLALAEGSDTLPAGCYFAEIAFDPARNLAVIPLSLCGLSAAVLYELDTSSDPPLLRSVDAIPPPTISSGQLVVDPVSGDFLRFGASPQGAGGGPAERYDPAQQSWSAVSTTADATVVVSLPEIPALVGFGPDAMWRWDAVVSDWIAIPAAGGANLQFSAQGGGRVTATELFFATVEGMDAVAYVVEPGDRPVLGLLAQQTGSPHGTDAALIDVTISGDVDAIGWLLEASGTAPTVVDPRWVSVAPTTYTLAVSGDRLAVVYLWLQFPDGSISTVPARASIWLLTAAPPAPVVTLRAAGAGDAGGAGAPGSNAGDPNSTETGGVFSELAGSFDGLVAIHLSETTTTPTAADFSSKDPFPLAPYYIVGGHGTVTVNVWTLDAAGHVSAMGSDDIEYPDLMAPSVWFDGGNVHRLVSGTEAVTWTASDPTTPVTYDIRLSTDDGCVGDLESIDGQSEASYVLSTAASPGSTIWLCVRAADGWTPPNVSEFIEIAIRYQATPARWYPLAPGPVSNGYADAVAYDTTRGRLLMFGGFDGSNYHRDVYVYWSGNDSWDAAPLSTSGSLPAGRGSARAFYDAATDRLVVYGGFSFDNTTTTYYADTVALDLGTATWSNLAPSGTPGGRDEFSAHFDPATGIWGVGPGSRGDGDYSVPYLYDLAENAWTAAPGMTGTTFFNGALADNVSGFVVVTSNAVSSYEPTSDLITASSPVTGAFIAPKNAVVDAATGLIVQVLPWCTSTLQQSRRTYVVDRAASLRFLSDADDIENRCEFGMLYDPIRRSVLLVMGYTEVGTTFTRSDLLHEFRIHGGPRLFAFDPVTSDESVFAGDRVRLDIGWDEGASEWLVNELAFPAPAAMLTPWQSVRPVEYVFSDSVLGERTIYVWIKDAAGAVVLDAGRWTIMRQ